MRLDKYLVSTGNATRSEAARAVRAGCVTVNGTAAKKPDLHINPDVDCVTFNGITVIYRKFTYIMLNKPQGVVSATDDKSLPTVLDLLPDDLKRLGLFPCGRLDRDTTGLMLLTDDGVLAHFLLSPVSHVPKTYRFTCETPLTESDVKRLSAGVDIGEDKLTKPASLLPDDSGTGGLITLSEGRYHQIKRMFTAVGNSITGLERISFGELILDTSLPRGGWRLLYENEITELQKHNRNKVGES